MSGLEPFFLGLQDELRAALGTGALIPHPGAKGDASELNWAGMLERHLPQRYRVVTKCFVLDHRGDLSHEIDIVLADRQYSPIVFQSGARQVIPAEAVYAVFEVKPQTDRANVLYSAGKARSVRALDRDERTCPDPRGRHRRPRGAGPDTRRSANDALRMEKWPGSSLHEGDSRAAGRRRWPHEVRPHTKNRRSSLRYLVYPTR